MAHGSSSLPIRTENGSLAKGCRLSYSRPATPHAAPTTPNARPDIHKIGLPVRSSWISGNVFARFAIFHAGYPQNRHLMHSRLDIRPMTGRGHYESRSFRGPPLLVVCGAADSVLSAQGQTKPRRPCAAESTEGRNVRKVAGSRILFDSFQIKDYPIKTTVETINTNIFESYRVG